jgi:hypothetical protein
MMLTPLLEFLAAPPFADQRALTRSIHLENFIGTPCPFCGVRLAARRSAWMRFVPAVHYAARVHADGAAACLACVSVRGCADLLELDGVPAAWLTVRQRVLESGTHHLTPWHDREAIRRELSRRSALPRVHLSASQADDGGLVIGWSRYSGGAPTLAAHAIYLRTLGGVILDSPSPLTLIHVPPARALDAVWSLIDRGALISRAGPVDSNRTDWRTFWWWHGDDYLAHRDRLGPFLVPIPLPPRTATATSTRRREQRRLVAARRRCDAAVASTDPMVVLHAVADGVESFVRGYHAR